jgi:hypothetical protein
VSCGSGCWRLGLRDGSMREIHRRRSVFRQRPQGSAMAVCAAGGVFVFLMLSEAGNWRVECRFGRSNRRSSPSRLASSLG